MIIELIINKKYTKKVNSNFYEYCICSDSAGDSGLLIDKMAKNAFKRYPINGHIDDEKIVLSVIIDDSLGVEILEAGNDNLGFDAFKDVDSLKNNLHDADLKIGENKLPVFDSRSKWIL